MLSKFLHVTKMQVAALSQILWLQLLSIVLYPLFFNPINDNNPFANVLVYATGLIMLAYLILRNFVFNDAKYKTNLLFGILPVSTTTILKARGSIIYLFGFIATPILLLSSHILHALKPETYAIIQPSIIPYGLVLFVVFMPIEFLLFYLFEAQKADIIGALALFPYMGMMAFLYKFLMKGSLWIVVLILGVFTNIVCYKISIQLYKNKEDI